MGVCNENSECSEGLECFERRCVEYVGAGENCDVNEEELICASPSGDGEGVCDPSLIFHEDPSDINEGICVQYVDLGEECNKDDVIGTEDTEDDKYIRCKRSDFDDGMYGCVDDINSSLGGTCSFTPAYMEDKHIILLLIIIILGIISFGGLLYFYELYKPQVSQYITDFFTTNTGGGGIQGNVTNVVEPPSISGTIINNPVGTSPPVGRVN